MDEFPFPVKGGRPRAPEVGESVYVPADREARLVGGLATVVRVDETRRARHVGVEVDGNPIVFRWSALAREQVALHARHEGARARYKTPAELEAERAAEGAKKAVEAERERLRWAPRRLAVFNGALGEVPVWCDHARARCWAATVDADPLKPGGLSRAWWNRARGDFFYYVVPATLRLHDVVEFAADYVRFSGSKDPERWYGVVVEVAEGGLTLQPCRDALAALTVARRGRESRDEGRPNPRIEREGRDGDVQQKAS